MRDPSELSMAKRKKTGGRIKGVSRNKSTTNAKEFVDAVFAKMKQSPEEVARTFLTCDDMKVKSNVFLRLLEYRYGRPTQPSEVSGKDGGPVQHRLVIERIGGPADTTSAQTSGIR